MYEVGDLLSNILRLNLDLMCYFCAYYVVVVKLLVTIYCKDKFYKFKI